MTTLHIRPAAALSALSLLLLAAADAPLAPGQWELRNTPGVATLDGRELHDLPLSEIKTQSLCLAASEVSDPARFFARDLGEDCSIAKAKVAGGEVRIAGTCPNQLEGPDSSFELRGRFDSGSYEVDFATKAVGDNGTMTFSGKMTGRRVGACTAG